MQFSYILHLLIIKSDNQIQMQKGLPNVSSIFRQIAHISIPDLSFTGKSSYKSDAYQGDYENYNNYSKNQQSSHQQLYTYKQQKHNELMNRFKNSFQENRRIIQICNQNLYGEKSITNKGYDYDFSVKSSDQGLKYTQIKSSLGLQNKSSRFNAPKIRYRHIQDFEPKQIKRQSYGNRDLQKQFYEDQNRQQDQMLKTLTKYPKSRNRDTVIHQQKPQQIYVDDQKSQSSQNNWINRQSKYEDKLESYYQLCRKTTSKLSKNTQEEKREDRFMRKQSAQKRTMELDQAIKLLSE